MVVPAVSATHRLVLRCLWAVSLAGLIAGSLLPGTLLPGLGRFDKLAHVSSYAAVMFLPSLHERWRTVLMFLGGSMVLGVMLEFLQLLTPDRFFEPVDVAANIWGALLGLSVGAILRPQVAPRRTRRANHAAANAPTSRPL
ncbi:MAG: VanZ family protein [Bryobacterales bacterium]|nr:VanZ family protein [Bryobacteraceae bacterium]MDW8355687.1 VanZ family protein [Bryobacterales bacterium]